jgi:hypothetical protein
VENIVDTLDSTIDLSPVAEIHLHKLDRKTTQTGRASDVANNAANLDVMLSE